MTSVEEIVNWLGNLVYQLPVINIRDIIEILLIAFVIYELIIWVRGTRAWMLFKGITFLGLISALAVVFELNTILWIFSKTINVGIIAVIIVFQPELRRALEQLGRRNLLNRFISFEDGSLEGIDEAIIIDIVKGVYEMAAVRTGALIVMEYDERLDEYEKTGIPIDAVVSRQILVNIFEHNTPLHDGAVIIRGNRIVAATCLLPLSDNMTLSKELGTRHRAGVGITEVSDAVVIIVSEETGKVSIAIGGNLVRGVEAEYLKNKLLSIYSKNSTTKKLVLWKGWQKIDRKDNP
ncbi:MAG: diadenylate cyclase CdaA [Vallitaleaceae bacterium]|nr:diadenylate cyclase CdaA [Vallitaleaceae bacterium]